MDRSFFFFVLLDLEPIVEQSKLKDQYGFIIPVKFEHHNQSMLQQLLAELKESYPDIVNVYSIGNSVDNVPLNVIEISDNPGKHEPGEILFIYLHLLYLVLSRRVF